MYEPQFVANVNDAGALAKQIQNPRRSRPVVVVTVAADRVTPWIDAEQIADQAGDLADVYVISTTDASWHFARCMPEGSQVYGGAGRVYPLGNSYLTDKNESTLRMAFNAIEGKLVTEELTSDALNSAFASVQIAVVPAVGTKLAFGEVAGFVAGRVLVKLDGLGYAYVAPELTLAEFSADYLFMGKQKVKGLLNPETKRLDVTESLISHREALSTYEIGDVVLALVHDVEKDAVHLTLYPKVVEKAVMVSVPREMVTGNPLDDLRDLLVVGDVVSTRLYGTAPRWAAVLIDIDEHEQVSVAPSLLPGGPPWLKSPLLEAQERGSDLAPGPMPPVLTPALASVSETSTEDLPRHGRKLTQQLLLSIENKKAQALELTDQVRTLGAHLEQAEYDRELLREKLQDAKREVNVLTADLKKSRTHLRKAKTSSAPSRDMPVFANSELGFRYLVLTQWALRLPAGEQLAKPIPDFTIGSKFLESFKTLQGITSEKVADVVVEIITGIASELDSREVHRLREGAGANAKPVVRDDGAVCMRASLQVGTASARRIHYWRLSGGSIELSRVTVHDDFNP